MLDRGNHCGTGDVWVCNSDGYVGQVWILSMAGEIQVKWSFLVGVGVVMRGGRDGEGGGMGDH